MEEKIKNVIASAIANARGMRRGAPSIVNILEMLPHHLTDEVKDDAANVITELEKAGFVIIPSANIESLPPSQEGEAE